MKISEILKKEVEKTKPTSLEEREIMKKAGDFVSQFKEKIKARKIKAEVSIGGSLAKGTLIKKDKYDVDVFVEFNEKYSEKEIKEKFESICKNIKIRHEKIHGSRDYFRFYFKQIMFEVIPVIKISKSKEARNITDFSMFHVKYVLSKLKNKNLADEIRLAKTFCYANECYGAESYIKGFSGYAIELLICYYKSFLNFIKGMAKTNKGKIIIDPEKYYKSKEEIMLNLNEAKLDSPIILIDPTFKGRNVLAALSEETFEKFKKVCKAFLAKPSVKFFQLQKINEKNFNVIIEARTNRQEGDIAGSKLLKFYNFLKAEIEKSFLIKKKEFKYDGKKAGLFYFSVEKRKIVVVRGPPANRKDNLRAFKVRHKQVFIKKGIAYAKEKPLSIKSLIENRKKQDKRIMNEMGITELRMIKIKE